MTVLYSDRTTPLSKNSGNALASAINLGWDFTGVDSGHDNGKPWIFGGATEPLLPITGTQTLTTVNGIPGRVAGASSLYNYTHTTDFGLQTGTGDFRLAIPVSTPATLPTNSNQVELGHIKGSAGDALILYMVENPGVGWYFTAAGSTSCPKGSSTGTVFFPANKTLVLWVQMVSGVMTIYHQNVTDAGNVVVAYSAGAAQTTPLDSTWAGQFIANYAGTASIGVALHAIMHWNTSTTEANLSIIGNNFWNLETNSTVTDSLAITSPTTGATINTAATVSGTYVGTTPSGIQVQHGSAGWVTGTSMTIGSGVWTGTFALAAASANTLAAREVNNNAIVAPSITGIVVAANAVTFTAPYPATSGQSYRLFQRNGSNQASVRLTGTLTGTCNGLEYSWDGAAWATLATGSGITTFDQTVTLTGPGQGDLRVRFTNNTAVIGTLIAVAVGDLFIVAGQSNHQGGGFGTYVPPVAPAGHPAWVAVEYSEAGAWRPNVETSGQPFADSTGQVYAVQGGSGSNTYFGKLATLCMAQGVPVGFIPCAKGSTSLASWGVSTSTSTLYGAMLAIAVTVGDHKAVLWWQGEANCSDGTLRSDYESGLNTLIDDWYTRQSRKWILMNLNATGNTVGSGGTGASDTGFNAIHAAIANVAATNTAHVAAIGDMNGSFSSSIHYSTAPEIDAVAAVAYGALNRAYNYSPILATTVTFSVVDAVTGVAVTGLTNLDYAFFDQPRISNATAPVKKGTTLAISGGVATIDITGVTTLTVGQTGRVVWGDSAGVKIGGGQVVVS